MEGIKKVPVLFIAFNRPEVAVESFLSIQVYQPKILYFAVDGPRPNNCSDVLLCRRTRDKILALIDWPCTLKTLFRTENVGCGKGVAGAINWMLREEEMGVIIEDDCQVSADFFRFCEVVLPLYKNDERVAQVNGFDLQYSGQSTNSYFFTSYPSCWGWATWRRAWKNIDLQMSEWKSLRRKVFKRFSFPEACIHYILWERLYRSIQRNKKLNIWDFQWSIYVFMQQKLCVNPFANLVINTGFGENSTNCNDLNSSLSKADTGGLRFPIEHPAVIELEQSEDKKKSREYLNRYREILFSKFRRMVKL